MTIEELDRIIDKQLAHVEKMIEQCNIAQDYLTLMYRNYSK